MARRRTEDVTERRTASLRVQLTPSERTELDARAARYGLSLSEFSRLVLLSDLKAPLPSPRDPQAIRELTVAITRVGVLNNQFVKVANEARSLPFERHRKAAAEQLAEALVKGECQAAARAVVSALEKVMTL